MSETYWPVPDSYGRAIPLPGTAGSFWEDRGDRRHCGIDIHAPYGSGVRAVEAGRVLDMGIMTSPDVLPYWNTTYYVLVRQGAIIAKYAELCDVAVSADDEIAGGTCIGHVGTVLNREAITEEAPPYIRRLGDRNAVSMLHFELYSAPPQESEAYLGGNWLGDSRPDALVDPTEFLKAAARGI